MAEYVITALGCANADDIKSALAALGMTDIVVKEHETFENYLATLSDKPVKGLADEVSNWFRSWGNGGGDYSTETCARNACNSDIPRELADNIYGEIADYSKTAFEALELIQDAISESLDELKR